MTVFRLIGGRPPGHPAIRAWKFLVKAAPRGDASLGFPGRLEDLVECVASHCQAIVSHNSRHAIRDAQQRKNPRDRRASPPHPRISIDHHLRIAACFAGLRMWSVAIFSLPSRT
jgi:hypothetical protein